MGSLGAVSAGLAAVGIAMGAAFEVKAAIDQTAKLGEQVYKMHAAFGLSAEAASKWIYVGQMAGLTGEQMEKSFGKFSKQLEAVQLHLDTKGTPGLGAFTEEMKKLGVRVDDGHKHVRDFTAILLDVSDAFARMSPEADKAGALIALFGKAGADLAPILTLGRQGITDLMNEAQKYGLVITTQNLPAIHAFIEAHRHLDAAMQGMQLTIGQILMPALTKLTEWVTNAFLAFRTWIDDNPKVIGALQDLVSSGIDFVHTALDNLVTVISGKTATSFDDLGTRSGAAREKLAGKDGLADSIIKVTDGITAFLKSKSTQDFLDFWKHAYDAVQKVVDAMSWLIDHSGILSGIKLGAAALEFATSGGSGGGPPPAQWTGRRQSGGEVRSGRYTVGEAGPETLEMDPGSTGWVYADGGAGAEGRAGGGAVGWAGDIWKRLMSHRQLFPSGRARPEWARGYPANYWLSDQWKREHRMGPLPGRAAGGPVAGFDWLALIMPPAPVVPGRIFEDPTAAMAATAATPLASFLPLLQAQTAALQNLSQTPQTPPPSSGVVESLLDTAVRILAASYDRLASIDGRPNLSASLAVRRIG
jgi:hypothetical protein